MVAQELGGGSMGAKPNEAVQLWSLLKPWPKVTQWRRMLGPELAMVGTHWRVSDSGLENGCGCPTSTQESVVIALSQRKYPEGIP